MDTLRILHMRRFGDGYEEKKRKTESLVIAAENNAAKIDYIQKRITYSLCGDRDETIDHIVSECRKLAKIEYKNKHDWVGNMIQYESCKKMKFHYMNKWYMPQSESVLENEMHEILWNFAIQRDQVIQKTKFSFV